MCFYRLRGPGEASVGYPAHLQSCSGGWRVLPQGGNATGTYRFLGGSRGSGYSGQCLVFGARQMASNAGSAVWLQNKALGLGFLICWVGTTGKEGRNRAGHQYTPVLTLC